MKMQSQNDNQDFFVFQKKTTDYIHVLFLCLIERLILNLNKNICKKWRGDAALKIWIAAARVLSFSGRFANSRLVYHLRIHLNIAQEKEGFLTGLYESLKKEKNEQYRLICTKYS